MELSSNVQTDTEFRLCRELVGRTIRLVEIDDPYTSLKPGHIILTDVCELPFPDTCGSGFIGGNTPTILS